MQLTIRLSFTGRHRRSCSSGRFGAVALVPHNPLRMRDTATSSLSGQWLPLARYGKDVILAASILR